MSISRQNLTVIIVTFKSEKVIHDCIQSIDSEIRILIIDNSNSKIFKENLEKKYENVSCILSEKNLGMGAGNNLGIKNVKTDFAFILNPDVVLDLNAINEINNDCDNLLEYSLNWYNTKLDENDAIIIGASNENQLDTNIKILTNYYNFNYNKGNQLYNNIINYTPNYSY